MTKPPSQQAAAIIRMSFLGTGFRKDLIACPAKTTKVRGQSNRSQPACSRGAAAHAQRNLILHANGKGWDRLPFSGKERFVRLEDQVIVERRAQIRVFAGRGNGVLLGQFGFDRQMKIERHSGGVKRSAQIR